jgi:hypothetical protein
MGEEEGRITVGIALLLSAARRLLFCSKRRVLGVRSPGFAHAATPAMLERCATSVSGLRVKLGQARHWNASARRSGTGARRK